jgi:hypothetical protein
VLVRIAPESRCESQIAPFDERLFDGKAHGQVGCDAAGAQTRRAAVNVLVELVAVIVERTAGGPRGSGGTPVKARPVPHGYSTLFSFASDPVESNR